MQVTETKNEGLNREYKVVVEAKVVSEQMETQLKGMSGRIKIPGFRPGHIPMNILRQRFGKEVFGEVIERVVNQSSLQILKDRSLKAALAPNIEIVSCEENADMEFTMKVEVLPEVPELNFASITLEKPMAKVADDDVEKSLKRLAEGQRTYKDAGKGAKSKKGSQVIIDFVGKTADGVTFEGGTSKAFPLVLGSGQFIEGFEDQLIGTKVGDEVKVKVTFPAQYHSADLAGKPATFDVTVQEVREGEESSVNDDLAKALGFKDIEAVKTAIRQQIEADYEGMSRAKVKKQLFDKLEPLCTFEIPASMEKMEFDAIWEKLQQAKKEGDESLKGRSDTELKAEYSAIARRRVKLGILLSNFALQNKIQVNQDELSRAVMQQASAYPGQERKVFELYQKNPSLLENLRGPILEEKSVDLIISKATIVTKECTPEELANDDDAVGQQDEAPKKTSKPKKKAANE